MRTRRTDLARSTAAALAALAAIGTTAALADELSNTPAATVQPDDRVRAAASNVRPAPPLTSQAQFDAEVEALKERAPEPAPEPEPEPEPEPAPAPPPAPAAPAQPSGSVWDRLAMCEASGNWASSVGTYEGGLQFHPDTWDAYKPAGYPEAAYEASREQQIAVGEMVLADQGWGAWPACSRKLGLR